MIDKHRMVNADREHALLPRPGGQELLDIRDHTPKAKPGDTVRVHHRCQLKDGKILDDSGNREPLRFTIGGGRLIAAFEDAVVGMRPGESKSVIIPADEAYGPRREDLLFKVDRSRLAPNYNPRIGQRLQVRQSDDQAIVALVIEVSEASIILDANHPLAGKDLVFDIRLMEISGCRRAIWSGPDEPLLGPVA